MNYTFFYGYVTGALLVLFMQLIKPFTLFSVLGISTMLLALCLVALLSEDKSIEEEQ